MTTPGEALEAILSPQLAGRRLDAALAEAFPGHSRSRLSAWLKDGRITVDGVAARGRDSVRGGEHVVVVPDTGPVLSAQGEDIPLEILHEDAHLIVINKPAGLVVHPGAGNPAGTLVNALLHRHARLAALPRAGIVHRLDKDTSGVMVVARSDAAQRRLVQMLAERAIHRQYLAVVQGALVSGGTVDAAMDRHPRDRLKRAIREDGRPAVTHYRLREKFRAHTALECRLETGRTHQIRVHMQHIRHPILGDPLYGGALKLPKGSSDALSAQLRGFKRQALHAQVLEFAHPVTNEPLRCQAPVPADLEALLAALREDTRLMAEPEPRW